MLPEIFGYDDRGDFAYALILDLIVYTACFKTSRGPWFLDLIVINYGLHSQGQDSNHPRDLTEMR